MSAVFVSGVHRSGTSVTAGILHHLGVWMGAEEFEPQTYNERGNYGDTEIHEILEDVLGNWRMPRTEFIPLAHQDLMDQIRPIIKRREENHAVWGSKSSYYPLYLFAIVEACPEPPLVLFPERDFEDSAMSLYRREEGRIPLRVCKDILSDYWRNFHVQRLTLEEDTEATCVRVPYDGIVNRPAEAVAGIASFVNGVSGYEPSKEQLQSAVEFIDPDLRHFGG